MSLFNPKLFVLLAISTMSLNACGGYQPKPVPGALIHLPFEKALDNMGSVEVRSLMHHGESNYKRGQDGNALYTHSKGGWLETHPTDKMFSDQDIEISFSFKRSDWINPYKQGAGAQTILAISGRREARIEHLSVSLYPGKQATLSVYVQDDQGKTHRFQTQSRVVGLGWHRVTVLYDADAKETTVSFDGDPIAKEQLRPAILANGIDQIKFGTWYKKNQAYRGLIDNFLIREVN